MVSFREVDVTDRAAQSLLDEYFASRALGFPEDMGQYEVNRPDPVQFRAPRGVFLVVEGEDLAGDAADVGCGGIRMLPTMQDHPLRYEVKHLFLQPHTRGRGYGRLLLAELERRALAFGAHELVLDTNASLEAAGRLYRSSGYTETEPYNDNRNATHWFVKSLQPGAVSSQDAPRST
ncbi:MULTISPECIES: GNAT family N-acetyltransferase [unclassified Salinibacterium]|uniref:GNAT family N-acetyltransferase n=1 Tax=unclassified Salinibacterium TaxID=2632331 RepID=UPI0014240173|nr:MULTISPECIES: GNAT family N-acetyltransferase [unclassified Salinibacterium]